MPSGSKISPTLSVGWMYSIGPGSLSMAHPIMFSSISLLPTCALAMMTICQTPGWVKLSMISRWYGARSVRQIPGSALLSETRYRFLSAHWETVCTAGGRNISNVYRASSARRTAECSQPAPSYRSFSSTHRVLLPSRPGSSCA